MNERGMEDIKPGFVMQNRSFPIGEGEGGWGLLSRIVAVKECDAIKDAKKY